MIRSSLRRSILLIVNAGLASLVGFIAIQSPSSLPEPPPRASAPIGASPVAKVEAVASTPLASDPFGSEEAAPTEQPAGADAAGRRPPPQITLVGTGLGEDSFAALRDSTGAVLRLRQGGAIEGWTLETVRRNEVIMSDAAGRWRLGFSPEASAPCRNQACVGPP
jgi:hypothetical protein